VGKRDLRDQLRRRCRLGVVVDGAEVSGMPP
jgi:hypothetical protein